MRRLPEDNISRPVLLVWRSRFWFNFYEFLVRLAGTAQEFQSYQPNLHFYLPRPFQPFYRPLLEAFGPVLAGVEANGTEYESVWQCCFEHLMPDRRGREALLESTLTYHGIAYRATTTWPRQIIFANRTGSRQISNLPQLLARCSSSTATCSVVDFGELTLARTVALLQGADALVGMHGADLANGLFLSNGSLIVEILGITFASPGSYGPSRYKFLNGTGLVHRQILAPESDPLCAARPLAASSNCTASHAASVCRAQHLFPVVINCAVTVREDALLWVWEGATRTAQITGGTWKRPPTGSGSADLPTSPGTLPSFAEGSSTGVDSPMISSVETPGQRRSDVPVLNVASAQPCAINGTVVGSFATVEYGPTLHELARTSANFGIPCIVSVRGAWRPASRLVRYLESDLRLLPRASWCADKRLPREYGWRLTHLYKPRLWHQVLRQGLNLLYLDANMNFKADPKNSLAALAAMHVDIVAARDMGKVQLGHLNIGKIWLRSTDRTIALAARVENRSWGSWDQAVFNEELDFGQSFVTISCCHQRDPMIPCMRTVLKDTGRLTHFEDRTERLCMSRGADVPRTALPPNGTLNWRWLPWGPTPWNASDYNEPVTDWHTRGSRQHHYNGRCTSIANMCPPCSTPTNNGTSL